MQLAILILAAGKASRMGAIKQLLKVDGKTLLENAISNSKKLKNSTVVCVLGAHATEIKKTIDLKSVAFTINKDHAQGLSSSIIAGIKHLEAEKIQFDGLFIQLADQPAIKLAYYQEMIALFSKEENKIIAANYGNKHGVPAIFPKAFINDLLKIIGDKGAKEFLQKNKKDIVSPKTSVNLLDIDTLEDYNTYINTL
jgi:molybdenum cofactor cytidylyltransferase